MCVCVRACPRLSLCLSLSESLSLAHTLTHSLTHSLSLSLSLSHTSGWSSLSGTRRSRATPLSGAEEASSPSALPGLDAARAWATCQCTRLTLSQVRASEGAGPRAPRFRAAIALLEFGSAGRAA